MTALASRSGVLDSEFLCAGKPRGAKVSKVNGRAKAKDDAKSKSPKVSAYQAVDAGGPRGDTDGSTRTAMPWLAVWAVTTVGGYLLAYSTAIALMP